MQLYGFRGIRTPSRRAARLLSYVSTFIIPFLLVSCGAVPSSAQIIINPIPIPTTVQLPTFGVAINAEGVLEARRFEDRSGRLFRERARAASRRTDPDMFAASPLRKISLRRLCEAMEESLAAGAGITDEMRHLAGLQRAEYLFCYAEEGDIILAGPAEGWVEDVSGRSIGVTTGRPVVLLEDLSAALRAFPADAAPTTFLGCTIDPDPEGLKRLVEFQRKVPRAVVNRSPAATARDMTNGIRRALGMANIHVFGLPEQCHMAHVLIEADYRMKRIAIGLEPPPVKMATFIGAASSASEATLQRWWFTPDYDCIRTTPDSMAMQIEGQGVQLNSEDKAIGADGQLVEAPLRPSRASQMYTKAFTSKYEEISAVSGVYAQMRNMIDLLIAAAFVQREGWYGRSGLDVSILLDETRFPIETLHTATTTPCVVNAIWKGRRLLAPAGGGVAINPLKALEPDRVNIDQTETLSGARGDALSTPSESWWWD